MFHEEGAVVPKDAQTSFNFGVSETAGCKGKKWVPFSYGKQFFSYLYMINFVIIITKLIIGGRSKGGCVDLVL